jgi:hypothetical protein
MVSRIPDWHQKYAITGALGITGVSAALALALAYLAIRGRRSVAQRIAAELLAFGIILVAVEVSIVAWTPDPEDARALRQHAAKKLNLAFDTRSVSEVVQDLRREGVDVLPGISGHWPQQPEVRRYLPAGLYPLSHASNAVVIECNEDGRYHSYRTDSWGFNNPPGLLDGREIDVALVGESYMLGHCLPEAETFAGRIREKYPRTANFGKANNGTLLELASFREYVERLQPRVVLWAVNPQFVELGNELRDPLLLQYLEPDFSQNLLERQSEIDGLVRKLALQAQIELDRQAKAQTRKAQIARFENAWRLPETRGQIRRQLIRAAGVNHSRADRVDLAVLRQSLHLAHQATKAWGGRLIVVLMPIYAEVVADQIRETVRHDHLAKIVSEMGIPVVDGVELFKAHPDPASHFTMRINNHPTAESYALLADQVLAEVVSQYPNAAIAAR